MWFLQVKVATGCLAAVALFGCSPGGGGGPASTNRLRSIRADRVCLDRLDDRHDAEDVACFDPRRAAKGVHLEVGDCVRATRALESGRVRQVRVVPDRVCET